MSRTFFVVSSGEYSDYEILGIFDDRTLVETFVARHFKDKQESLRVEEHAANPHTLQLREGLTFYSVDITLASGSVIRAEVKAPDDDQEEHVWKWGTLPGSEPGLGVYCWARDVDHAIKIAIEKRQEWIAKEAGY